MKKLTVILGVAGVSLSSVFVRLSDAPAEVLAFYRMAMAAALLCPAVLWKFRAELKGLTKKQLLLCLMSGVFLGLHFCAYFTALSYTSIASAVVLVDTEVFFVAFAMLLIFKERLSKKGWLGVGVTFAGSVIIALGDAGETALLGDGIALLGALFMAVYTLTGKVCRKSMSTTVYTFLVYTAAAVSVAVIAVCSKTPLFGYAPVNYLTGFGMATGCTLLGHSVFSWGLKYLPASYISDVKLLEPVFATLLGLVLFAELPGPYAIIGGVAVIAGVLICSRAQPEEGVQTD